MTKSRSINRNHDDASSSNTFKTYENSGAAPWSGLIHDVLFSIMMKVGVIDFVSFSGVCKSWRSFALSNRKKFMASKPPMMMEICKFAYLEDFERRRFKTLLPHSGGRRCVGFTCGYVVLFGMETEDFWLVNLITRHQLHFPNFPCLENVDLIKAILVSSPSIPGLVLVVVNIFGREIWVSIAGKGAWDHVRSKDYILDIQVFKGKIYTLNFRGRLYEMSLNPKPKLTKLELEDFKGRHKYYEEFASSGESLYVIYNTWHPCVLYEVDFGEMKRVYPEEKTIGECVFLYTWSKHGVAIKPESWAVEPRSGYKSYDCFRDTDDETRKCRFFKADMWYFPHLCLDVDPIDE